MEFEEMKKIWDSNNQETLYAIDEEGLHQRIRSKGQEVGRHVAFFEWILILSTIFVSIVFFIDSLSDPDSWVMATAASLILVIPIYLAIQRGRRKGSEVEFPESVVGEVDRAIYRQTYLIRRMKNLVWWYILPFLAVASFAIYFQSRSLGWWLLSVGVFAVSFVANEWEVRKVHRPKLKDLEALRRLLVDSEA